MTSSFGRWLPRAKATLNPRSILVTGSSRGIGLEIVKQLVEKSNRPELIFATCRDPDGPRSQNLKNLAAKHQGLEIVQLDVCKPSTIKEAAAKVSELLKGAGLNILINNAGIIKVESTLESEKQEDMLEVFKTNVVGHMLVSQAFLPLLQKAAKESTHKGMNCNKAAILNMSSEAGSITNVYMWEGAQVLSYRCSKAALNMLTKCQGLQHKKDKILCVAIHPGWLQTDMGNSGVLAPTKLDDGVRRILGMLPSLSEKNTGTFVCLDGKTLPW
ncbi:C-factor-like [Sceloporus undulatus]|uniref:C-factor-like n=1 Tax=Sceloporus undulatus TaxID=8520 RepID=UPI001C4B06A5|nr:C-factor-like [Sceloporus undulatus]